ncbi:Neil3 [Symbiodinium sp. CCMP2592]|nr:Neil3 [Symbiodinium sp. CCMP2592]
MSSIRGLETISGGLIVNLGGKKVGIHVGDNENLHQWSRALLSVLAPNKAERSSASPRTPADRPRSQTPTPRSTPRKGRDWVPEVAYKSTKSTQAGGKQGGSRAGAQRFTVMHRGVSVDSLTHLMKVQQPEKRFYVHTHKGGTEAVETLHGKSGKFLASSHQVGSSHVRAEIAAKPYSRSESNSAISTRSTSREEGLTWKVTGEDRQISPRRRVDHSFGFWKINSEEAAVVTANPRSRTPPRAESTGSRSRSRTPPDETTLTAKAQREKKSSTVLP